MDQSTLLALIMLALGKAMSSVPDDKAVAIGKQLASEILALQPAPSPAP